MGSEERRVLWRPSESVVNDAVITRYLAWLADRGQRFDGYESLWQWSVREIGPFWSSVWEFFDVLGEGQREPALGRAEMPGAQWFPNVRLSYAENALRADPSSVAIVARDEAGKRRELTVGELRRAVADVRAHLVARGVGLGDRVVGYLPNGVEAVVAFLATASLGAIWSSCPPEFGAASVLDRFAQIEPKVLFGVGSYRYGGKSHDRSNDLRTILNGLPSLTAVVSVGTTPLPVERLDSVAYDDIPTTHAQLAFERVPFDHPLWILYSSGTTGLPKAIVQGHGGIVLEHLKILGLHGDLRAPDRFFWFSTTGWMMWNYLVGGLLVGSTIVLYDGNPGFPNLDALWAMAAEERVTYFGGGAPYFMACRKAGIVPRRRYDLSRIRGVGSTGAPLPAEGFEWVYEAVGDDLLLGSVSGGTDLCTAFVGSCPLLEVRAGELQCRALGANVQAFDSDGKAVVDQVGELVITAPMPSMPVYFWGDENGERYEESYFSTYPGVWRHGDWIELTSRGSAVITGRSDSTLNRGGVRMGTSEFYRIVEALPDVADSLVIDAVDGLWLFVTPRDGSVLGAEARQRIAATLRTSISPRHVPDHVVVVRAIPTTLSGKKVEIPVKRVLDGADARTAVNAGTLKDGRAFAELVEAVARYREASDAASTGA